MERALFAVVAVEIMAWFAAPGACAQGPDDDAPAVGRAVGRHVEVEISMALDAVVLTAPSREGSGGGDTSQRLDLDALAARAVRDADAVWDLATQRFGASSAEEHERRKIYVYGTREGYIDACDRLVQGRFRENGAFSSQAEHSSHVLLQPVLSAAVLDRIGLPYPTRRLVMHEAGHLATYNAFPKSYPQHPFWLAEGFATWLENTVAEGLAAENVGCMQPRSVEGYVTVQRLRAGDELPPVADLLLTSLPEQPFYARYALARCWFEFLLAERPAEMGRFLVRLGERRRLPVRDLAKLLQRSFRRSDWESVESEFGAWVDTRPVGWSATTRSLYLQDKDLWTHCAFDTSVSFAVRADAPLEPPYEISGRVEVLGTSGAVAQANIVLGYRSQRELVSVAMRADSPSVTLMRPRPDRWVSLASSRIGGWSGAVPFRVRVGREGKVRVEVAGKLVIDSKVDPEWVSGLWGVSVQRGTAALWHGVAVRSLDRIR